MLNVEYDPNLIWEQFKQHCFDILADEENWEDQFNDMTNNLLTELSEMIDKNNKSVAN